MRWLTASRKLVTGVPFWVNRSSGSSVRLPTWTVKLSLAIVSSSCPAIDRAGPWCWAGRAGARRRGWPWCGDGCWRRGSQGSGTPAATRWRCPPGRWRCGACRRRWPGRRRPPRPSGGASRARRSSAPRTRPAPFPTVRRRGAPVGGCRPAAHPPAAGAAPRRCRPPPAAARQGADAGRPAPAGRRPGGGWPRLPWPWSAFQPCPRPRGRAPLDRRRFSREPSSPQGALADHPGRQLGVAAVLARLGQVDPAAQRQATLAAMGESVLVGVGAAWQHAELRVQPREPPLQQGLADLAALPGQPGPLGDGRGALAWGAVVLVDQRQRCGGAQLADQGLGVELSQPFPGHLRGVLGVEPDEVTQLPTGAHRSTPSRLASRGSGSRRPSGSGSSAGRVVGSVSSSWWCSHSRCAASIRARRSEPGSPYSCRYSAWASAARTCSLTCSSEGWSASVWRAWSTRDRGAPGWWGGRVRCPTRHLLLCAGRALAWAGRWRGSLAGIGRHRPLVWRLRHHLLADALERHRSGGWSGWRRGRNGGWCEAFWWGWSWPLAPRAERSGTPRGWAMPTWRAEASVRWVWRGSSRSSPH